MNCTLTIADFSLIILERHVEGTKRDDEKFTHVVTVMDTFENVHETFLLETEEEVMDLVKEVLDVEGSKAGGILDRHLTDPEVRRNCIPNL